MITPTLRLILVGLLIFPPASATVAVAGGKIRSPTRISRRVGVIIAARLSRGTVCYGRAGLGLLSFSALPVTTVWRGRARCLMGRKRTPELPETIPGLQAAGCAPDCETFFH